MIVEGCKNTLRGRIGQNLKGCIFEGREKTKLAKRVYKFFTGTRMHELAKGQDKTKG